MSNCRLTLTLPLVCAGKLEGNSLTQTTTNTDCVTAQAGAAIYRNTLIANGTGYGVNAASGISIPVAGNVMFTGLGSNVTNTVTTPYNVIDSHVQ